MDAINKMQLLLVIIFPLLVKGQDAPFPKDTIYIKYSANKKENRKIVDWEYQDKKGIYFSIKDSSHKAWADSIHFISLFYPYSKPTDTLPLKRIGGYHFSDLKEIDEKRYNWIFDYNRPPLTRNKVFKTYLIEVINDSQFVIYPVIWRNEGATP